MGYEKLFSASRSGGVILLKYVPGAPIPSHTPIRKHTLMTTDGPNPQNNVQAMGRIACQRIKELKKENEEDWAMTLGPRTTPISTLL